MQALLTHPLLAADIKELIIPLLAVLFAVLKHLFDASKKPAARPATPPAPQQKPVQPAKPVPVGGQQADQLRSQVEEFLRRSGRPPQAADQPTGPPQQRPTSEIEVLVSDAARQQGRRLATDSPRPIEARKSPPIVNPDKRPARRSVTPKKRVTLAERAADRETVRLSTLPDKPAHLGTRIAEEDKQFDSQLKAKFDHTIGTLAESSPQPQSPNTLPSVNSQAAQIAAMLANPDGIRTAVLLNEILHRPSDRW